MLENFCKPFNFDLASVPETVVKALVELKKQRNTIVHDLSHSNNFEQSFRYVVAIMCCIYFCWGEAKAELKIFPWHDYHDKFQS